MELGVSLLALINHCTRLLENGDELSLEETEKAFVDEKLVELLQQRFGFEMDLTVFSTRMNNSAAWKEVNEQMRTYLISDINPSQPGTSGDRYGVTRNGLALIVVIASELLYQNLR